MWLKGGFRLRGAFAANGSFRCCPVCGSAFTFRGFAVYVFGADAFTLRFDLLNSSRQSRQRLSTGDLCGVECQLHRGAAPVGFKNPRVAFTFAGNPVDVVGTYTVVGRWSGHFAATAQNNSARITPCGCGLGRCFALLVIADDLRQTQHDIRTSGISCVRLRFNDNNRRTRRQPYKRRKADSCSGELPQDHVPKGIVRPFALG